MAFGVTVFIEVCLPFARSSDIDPIRIHICAGLVLVSLCKAAASCLLDLGATADGSRFQPFFVLMMIQPSFCASS
jgi:hypothetical protein